MLPDEWENVPNAEPVHSSRADNILLERRCATVPIRPRDFLDNPEGDKLPQMLYPPQNSGELGIRNLHVADSLTYCLKTGRQARAAEVLRLCRGFDYILTCNLITALFHFINQWCKGLTCSGVFDGDSEHYRTSCETLSDVVKTTKNELTDDERVCFYECAELFGAMCPPVSG
ncbi:hypothetical protein MRX96_001437 [Rhipicephalus microplus]